MPISSVITNMNKTYSQPQTESLPRISSQKKFSRNVITMQAERKHSEEEVGSMHSRIGSSEKQGLHVRLTSDRKTLQSANSSKAVKYEATNAILLKKVEALEKQNFMLDKELGTVREEINQLRVQKKLGDDDTVTVVSQTSKAASRRSEGLVKNDIKVATNRLDVLRKKIDKENERNRKIEREVDKVRKEITTTKRLNEQMENQLREVSERYNFQCTMTSKLEEEISSKNEQMHKKKIDSIHQKAHLIKSYDTILKKLDQQLEQDKPKHSADGRTSKTDLYITDINPLPIKPRKAEPTFTDNSPKSKKTTAQMTFLKQKITEYEQHFTELRDKTGSGSIEEVTKKFIADYEQNFGLYNFINQMHAHLEELKERNSELKKRQEEIKQELEDKRKSRTKNELTAAKERISKIQHGKGQIKEQMSECDSQFLSLKNFVIDFLQRIPLADLSEKYQIDRSTNFQELVTPSNLVEFLQEILKLKEQLECIPFQNSKAPSHLSSVQADYMIGSARSNNSVNHLQECLEWARKETPHEKEKLFNREDFLQAKELQARRRTNGSKNRSQKN